MPSRTEVIETTAGKVGAELARRGIASIVSGDADLLALNPFQDIPIIPPAVFVQSVAR
jgi:predicted nucleic acid-binding protein